MPTIENGFRTCCLLSVAAAADDSSDEEMNFDEERQQIIDMLEENDLDSSFDGFEESDEEDDKN